MKPATSLSQAVSDIRALSARLGRTVQFMEVCGTHTMAVFRSGLRALLPPEVKLLSGPGCPVCVTPNRFVDRAIAIARQPGVLVTTFGDMMRVPGSECSLEQARAAGAAVRVVYSPLDALKLAEQNPQTRVVFLGVGFETTAPTIGWTIQDAARRGVRNYSALCAHKTMPQAMAALAAGELRVDGFICPGHVSIVTGTGIYEFLARKHKTPCVVAGFEAADIAQSMAMLLRQITEGRSSVEIQYTRAVTPEGNAAAQAVIADVFEPSDEEWRGIGLIPGSGLSVRAKYAQHDAAKVFAGVEVPPSHEPAGCRCGEILRGVRTPPECPLFRKVCTPASPVGACMVSSEGTCAAYYRYAAEA